MIGRRYTLAELEDLPTLSTGQADDLKIDTGRRTWAPVDRYHERVWLSRVGIEDGAAVDHEVTVQRYMDGRWVTVDTYPAA